MSNFIEGLIYKKSKPDSKCEEERGDLDSTSFNFDLFFVIVDGSETNRYFWSVMNLVVHT